MRRLQTQGMLTMHTELSTQLAQVPALPAGLLSALPLSKPDGWTWVMPLGFAPGAAPVL